MVDKEIFNLIKNAIAENDVVLFMKGTKDFPMCGFSSTVVNILKKLNINFKDYNVIDNSDLRQAIKLFSDWPTIPQLYCKGHFIGGCDIVKELYENNELESMINKILY